MTGPTIISSSGKEIEIDPPPPHESSDDFYDGPARTQLQDYLDTPPRAARPSGRGLSEGDEPATPWRALNDRAMANFPAWVPKLFPSARKTDDGGFRISSAALGRKLQEDLSISPQGIVDFGVADMGDEREGKRTPIELVEEHLRLDFDDAMQWLAEALKPEPATGGDAEPASEAQPEPAAPAILKWIDMARWDSDPAPPREWSIPGRVPRRQVGLFSGEGGTGKSIIEMQKNVAHVTGMDWLGATPTRGPAIYVGCEDETDELHRRFEAIAAHYGVNFRQLIDGGLMALCRLGEDAVLCATGGKSGKVETTEFYAQLFEAAGDIKPINISLDTLSRVFAGNEIDRVQVYAFAMHMQRLALVANASVTILAHPSLAGIASGSGISGSTAWHGAFRFRQYLKSARVTEDQPETDLRELEFKKNQYGPTDETMALRYARGLFLPASVNAMADHEADALFLTLLDRFTAEGRNVSHIKQARNFAPTAFAEALPGKRKAFSAAMERLFTAGAIKVEEYGKASRPASRLVRR